MPADALVIRIRSWLSGLLLFAAVCPAALTASELPDGGAEVRAVADRLAQAAFSGMPAGPVASPWRVVGLPGQKIALTRFDIRDDSDRQDLILTAASP